MFFSFSGGSDAATLFDDHFKTNCPNVEIYHAYSKNLREEQVTLIHFASLQFQCFQSDSLKYNISFLSLKLALVFDELQYITHAVFRGLILLGFDVGTHSLSLSKLHSHIPPPQRRLLEVSGHHRVALTGV